MTGPTSRLDALTAPAQDPAQDIYDVFYSWGKSHEIPDFIVRLPYDLELYPHQHPGTTVIEQKQPSVPQDSKDFEDAWASEIWETARSLGRAAMGHEAYDKLINDIKSGGLKETIKWSKQYGRSSIVLSGHLTNTLDVALSHNAFFVAAESSDFARSNVMLANHLMAFLGLVTPNGVMPVTDALSYSGPIILGTPTEGAKKYGMPEDVLRRINRGFVPELSGRLDEGIVLHRAPTETRAKDIILVDGTKAKMLPAIPLTTARSVRKRSPNAMGVAMNMVRGQSAAKLLVPRPVQIENDFYELVGEMVGALSELSGQPVVYGLPEGAKLADV